MRKNKFSRNKGKTSTYRARKGGLSPSDSFRGKVAPARIKIADSHDAGDVLSGQHAWDLELG